MRNGRHCHSCPSIPSADGRRAPLATDEGDMLTPSPGRVIHGVGRGRGSKRRRDARDKIFGEGHADG